MIYTFSGTGNSKYVADKLSKYTGDEIFSINDSLKNNIKPKQPQDDEKIVIVCPTYAWRIPNIVNNWIRNNDFGKRKKIWFVMTCGGEIGNAAKYNQAIANDKGLTYMGSKGIKLPDNYIIMFKPIEQDEANKMFTDAEIEIKNVAEHLNKSSMFLAPRNNLYDKAMSGLVNPMFNKSIQTKLFKAGNDCNGCGTCVNKCPLNNITLVNGKPVWGNSCTHCMACISYCPKATIEYGNKTLGKRRYTKESYYCC